MLRSKGRGRNYSRTRSIAEPLLRAAFAQGWPARLWGVVPGATRVTAIRQTIALLPAGVPDLRIGFASDLHIGPTTPRDTLEAAFDILRDEAPDVLMLGGDYIMFDTTEAKARKLGELVASVPARTKLAVLGNHDLWDRHDLLEDALADSGAEVLVNASARLPAPHDDVVIVGLDDPWTGTPDPDAAFAACPNGATRIVLCHAPEGIRQLRGRNVSLLVCGHTHGGQVAVAGTPLYINGEVGKRYRAGLHEVDGMSLFISRGLGGVEIPMRFGAPPDVLLITLTARS